MDDLSDLATPRPARGFVANRHRVLIADDHEALRRGVRVTLEGHGFRVVAECGNGAAAVAAARRLRPEVCLLDVHMPDGGIEAASEIHRALPGTKIVMLTVSANAEDLFGALRAGACGYLLKTIDPERLPRALLGVLNGEAALPRALVLRLIEAFRGEDGDPLTRPARPRLTGLTPRESDVLELLASGYSTAQIGSRLSISAVTVRSHVASVLRKLRVHDREAAVDKLRAAGRAQSAELLRA